MRVGWLKMAIFTSFVHCLPNILHAWPHDSFQVIQLSMTLGIFQGQWTVSYQISLKRCLIRQKLHRLLIGNHTLAFYWCHFWWPWSTFEGHFSLGSHFHVHLINPWHAFASHGLPAIAELLVVVGSETHVCDATECIIPSNVILGSTKSLILVPSESAYSISY